MEVKVQNIETNARNITTIFLNLTPSNQSDVEMKIEIEIDEYKINKEMEALSVHSLSLDHPHTQNIPTSRGGITGSVTIGKRPEV
ncbi:hypothetical protein [Adhaeribacter radiodurans]|uniref:Uncharacterized protein n=1 Tax=Adhaeribacter radiodurans TaxID=2745197 RepID=A0A7L7LCF5_9BACT|nr:hypothetical protein [Adhaeribacter radiodurans]QMU30526.1 hypothetical protein HUW48_21985 [Adhaeribacter radiodurans]